MLQGLQHALEQNRLHHAYLFSGTRGVGKTTLARIIAKCMNCDQGVSSTPCGGCSSCQEIEQGRSIDLIEIDAASNTKVEDTRELLDNVQYAPTHSRYKIYLIDEVHMLYGHSFNALLKTLEEPPEHVKFLLATTDPQKLPITVLSRCLQFHLQPIAVANIIQQMQYILQQEGVKVEPAALPLLAHAAQGSLRDGLSVLDQAIAYGQGQVSLVACQEMLGTVGHAALYAILDALALSDAKALEQAMVDLLSQGSDHDAMLVALGQLLHQIALQQALGSVPDSQFDEERLAHFAQCFEPELIQVFYQMVIMGRKDLPYAPDARAGLEMVAGAFAGFSAIVFNT